MLGGGGGACEVDAEGEASAAFFAGCATAPFEVTVAAALAADVADAVFSDARVGIRSRIEPPPSPASPLVSTWGVVPYPGIFSLILFGAGSTFGSAECMLYLAGKSDMS